MYSGFVLIVICLIAMGVWERKLSLEDTIREAAMSKLQSLKLSVVNSIFGDTRPASLLLLLTCCFHSD